MLPPDDIAPIPCLGPDTRMRWLVRDIPRPELETYLNAACALGWELDEVATIQEAEPPLTPEIVRVWMSGVQQAPKRRRKAAPKVPEVAD